MHVQGEAVGGAMVERVSLSHLRFALAESMDSTREVLGLLYPLLGLVDPALCALLRDEAELEEPLFALSWVLTWFSHDLCDVRAHPSCLCTLSDPSGRATLRSVPGGGAPTGTALLRSGASRASPCVLWHRAVVPSVEA
jgi:hypothetical protein